MRAINRENVEPQRAVALAALPQGARVVGRPVQEPWRPFEGAPAVYRQPVGHAGSSIAAPVPARVLAVEPPRAG